MTRARTFRLVSIAVVFAFALAVAGVPGMAAAATRSSAKAGRTLSVSKVPRLRTAAIGAAAVDDEIPGVATALPFSLTDSLTDLTDIDDVFAIDLTVGDEVVITLYGPSSSNMDLYLYPPGTTTVDGSEGAAVMSVNDGSNERIVYTAEVTGTYYIHAYLLWGTGGSYKLSAGDDIWSDDDPSLKTVPFSSSMALGTGIDYLDFYSVHLAAGQSVHVTLSGTAGTDFDAYLFAPDGDDPVAFSANPGTSESFYYTAPTSGTYYLDVWQFEESGPGNYTLSASAGLTPTSITIKTAATTTYIGRTVTLSGAVTPFGMVGKNIVAYVMKPGKTYWTYSSNRTVYNLGGKAAWQYKYYFKPGMTKGYYKFKAVAPAPGFASSLGWLTSTSPTIVTIRLR